MQFYDAELWPSVVARYHREGWWGEATFGSLVAQRAVMTGDAVAFVGGGQRLTWAEYDAHADRLAWLLHAAAGLNLRPGGRVAVWLPDLPMTHAVYVAVERAGGVIVGIGARAGIGELQHLMMKTGASVLVTLDEHRGRPTDDIVAELRRAGLRFAHLVLPRTTTASGVPRIDGVAVRWRDCGVHRVPPDVAVGPDDVWLLNSTSGTTGMPKCVVHNQNRWFAYHQIAVEAGALTADDVWLSALPSPFGFGIWTAHATPTISGSTTVLTDGFDAVEVLRLIELHRVTVLACVSTQFIMLLNALDDADVDLSSLRVMFTGGEAVPFERAARFEERFGATVLQFFGSNETGALSRTTLTDTREQRLMTAGRVIPSMQVRLFDEAGAEVTASCRGIPAGRGALTCLGYYDDPAANRQLFTDDGWMLMGDIVELDADGYLTVVGRTADVIIRGGKNISAAQVEDVVLSHPAVAMAGAVAVPDEVFGERVCVFVELAPDMDLTLGDLQDYLGRAGVTKELWPELLDVMPALPRASGGKVAKGELRKIAVARATATATATAAKLRG